MSVHDYGARLRTHIEAHYTKQRSGAGPVQAGTNTTTGADHGGKNQTHALVRVYWKLRKGIFKKVNATGFRSVKIHLLLLWDISTIAYTILNVEFSLRMNNIDDIYNMWTVGQLIPVIIGAGGIGVAAAELYVYYREKIGEVAWGSLGVARIELPPLEQASDEKTETPPKGVHGQKPEAFPEKAYDKETESNKGEKSQLERIESPTSASVHVDDKSTQGAKKEIEA